jgi:primase-polymerase (primpol)-like protein
MQKTSITDNAAFLNWRYEVRGNADKPTKPPYSARDNYPVGTGEADRHRLTVYAAALKNQAEGKPHSNIEPERGFDGVGFVFTRFYDKLYICGIDIDHQAPDGAFVARIKAMFPNAYIELSPSGEGIHIIILVDISRIPTKRVTDNSKERVKLHKQYYSKNPHNGVEVYVGALTNRYFTFTGNTIQDGQDIDQTDEFIRFLTAYMTRQSKQTSGAAEPNAGNADNKSEGDAPLDLSDDEILILARNAANGAKFIALYDNGDLSPYSGDESGADMGLMNMLAFWTRCNGTAHGHTVGHYMERG